MGAATKKVRGFCFFGGLVGTDKGGRSLNPGSVNPGPLRNEWFAGGGLRGGTSGDVNKKFGRTADSLLVPQGSSRLLLVRKADLSRTFIIHRLYFCCLVCVRYLFFLLFYFVCFHHELLIPHTKPRFLHFSNRRQTFFQEYFQLD